jgi:hypothetical protein
VSARALVLADRASLAGMALGLALMLALDAAWAFRAGFFVVLGATAAQIVFSHLSSRAP